MARVVPVSFDAVFASQSERLSVWSGRCLELSKSSRRRLEPPAHPFIDHRPQTLLKNTTKTTGRAACLTPYSRHHATPH
jgi:hypothetical protein